LDGVASGTSGGKSSKAISETVRRHAPLDAAGANASPGAMDNDLKNVIGAFHSKVRRVEEFLGESHSKVRRVEGFFGKALRVSMLGMRDKCGVE
jgi:hypothetical protein